MREKTAAGLLLLSVLALLASCHAMESSVEIQAPPSVVWREFVDFASYPDWNPFLVHLDGTPVIGGELRVEVRSEDGRVRELHPIVRTLERERVLEWESGSYLPGLFTERYRFELLPIPGKTGTLFVQRESFRGILVPFFQFAPLLSSSQQMNQRLRVRAEHHERAETGEAQQPPFPSETPSGKIP